MCGLKVIPQIVNNETSGGVSYSALLFIIYGYTNPFLCVSTRLVGFSSQGTTVINYLE